MTPHCTAIADHALLVSFGTDFSQGAHDAVLALDRALAADMPPGAIETVPAIVNLLVSFDPLVTDHGQIETHVRARLETARSTQIQGKTHRVPVCYDAPFAPDLTAVATATGLSPEAIINAHLAGQFSVLMYGFAPGYAYLSGVPAPIQVPRKPSPIRDVPAGSVIIAGGQCLITTLTMPTGWSIIGRSPTAILTGDDTRPFLFDVGDTVTFERISADSFARQTAAHV
ncbi:allophanate hydrolase subunit 1 [uncultured Tateyamaria sp.]|uniref:5-oxoprolinase subunit B family protein n=1 Tax=uncultured Tateyamaria sp. TaxID=455651 RepID=UPI00262EAD24|nr:allophanate hydrolase subunit 1 [uncultured Tateyamaria sp.]